MRRIIYILFGWVTIPHQIAYLCARQKSFLDADIDRWIVCSGSQFRKYYNGQICVGGGKLQIIRILCLVELLLSKPEFRNVFYLRLGGIKYLLYYLRPYETLYIFTPSREFGPGVYIQHGFATVITAEHVGKNCWINQQVTVGYNDSNKYGYGKPWIGDDVRISAGAKVVGNVKVGGGSTIGVNAVVVKDVAANSTVIPSPMILIRENGERVHKPL